MAKPKNKKADGRDAASPQSQLAPGHKEGHAWSFGVNDHCDHVSDQALKCFTPTHHFKSDFSVLCDLAGIVPHTALAAPKTGTQEGSECQSLAVQSMLMDLASMRVMRHVLHTSTHLHTIRLTAACLDFEMMHLLRLGLTDGNGQSTVHTLHIDWNPLDLPVDPEAMPQLPDDGGLEALDEFERQRLQAQAERDLRIFSAQLQATSQGGLSEVLQEVAAIADPNYAATALLKPLSLWSFTEAVQAKVDLSSEEVTHVFKILDMPCYGPGDGFVSFARLEEVLNGLPEPNHDEEQKIGTAFADFLDGTSVLEVVSFRCCYLGAMEAQALGKSMQSSQHLRALNLWGNRICDHGAASLAEAFEHNHGLQYLGLGRNLVTHVGLESFCKVLGMHRIDDKDQATSLMKQIKDLNKDRDKKAAKLPPGPKKDASGRERYTPEFYHVDKCEERKDPLTGQVFWVWAKNTTLKTLVLERNPIADAEAVKRLKPHGVGDLVLRGTPCAEVLLKGRSEKAEQQATSGRPDADAEADYPESPVAGNEVSGADGPGQAGAALPPALVLSPTGGWRLVLQ